MANRVTVKMSWDQRLRIDGWIFEQYRNERWLHELPGDTDINLFRNVWRGRTLPQRGRVRRERYQAIAARGPLRVPVTRAQVNPNLLDQIPGIGRNALDLWQNARARYISTRDYFSQTRGLTLVSPLGYGGLGLALKGEYRRNPTATALPFVMKLALDPDDEPDLYLEGRMTERFDRAAHVVQVVPRSRVGLPPQRPSPYPIQRSDDSSSSENGSGDESYDDQPSDKVAKNASRTRAQQENDNRAEFRNKRRRFRARVRRVKRLQAERSAGLAQPNPDPMWQADRKEHLLLEFAENGDLEKLIIRLNQDNEDVPNRVLWGFWLCLTQACLAMQYPPRKFHPGRREDHPVLRPGGQPGFDLTETGKRLGDDLFEQEPLPRRRWAAKRIVHFDIDPKNILIGGLDAGAKDQEHALVPRLKLADFGIADEIKPNKRNIYYNYRRRYGKWGYYAPEQFGFDWDFVKKAGGSLINKHGFEIGEQNVAGNYGSHTNVWGIALTMWQLITKFRVQQPPLLQRTRGAGDQMADHYCGELLTEAKYDRVDIELRETVARCMAHDPRRRPRVRTLVAQAKRGIMKRFNNETDRNIREWVQRNIFNPPLRNGPRVDAGVVVSAPGGRRNIPPGPPGGTAT
ncbi:kinase-like domain-containing protein [Xylaria arbuscula]|nr:kinase-like domain-containing protein [Xylaria arbuscula]